MNNQSVHECYNLKINVKQFRQISFLICLKTKIIECYKQEEDVKLIINVMIKNQTQFSTFNIRKCIIFQENE
ncbi:unnamed protein product [Paramecium octaurelia]|uniref:Uncharacterized protein n=1 Tax=Paramecium octaurelia TaxID=43137 RepID=A0A8S1ULH7_PAROT|nr:unnamed protein product [Paramecium octaurelia]